MAARIDNPELFHWQKIREWMVKNGYDTTYADMQIDTINRRITAEEEAIRGKATLSDQREVNTQLKPLEFGLRQNAQADREQRTDLMGQGLQFRQKQQQDLNTYRGRSQSHIEQRDATSQGLRQQQFEGRQQEQALDEAFRRMNFYGSELQRLQNQARMAFGDDEQVSKIRKRYDEILGSFDEAKKEYEALAGQQIPATQPAAPPMAAPASQPAMPMPTSQPATPMGGMGGGMQNQGFTPEIISALRNAAQNSTNPEKRRRCQEILNQLGVQ